MQWNAKLYHDNSAIQYRIGEAAIDRLKPQVGERILEIGCGPGDLTQIIARHIDPGEITAIDISQNMIDQANATLVKSGMKNVRFACIDAMAIQFNAEFDAIFSNEAIHWIPTQRALYKKMYKALKQRGRIMLSTLGDPAEPGDTKENGEFSNGLDIHPIEIAAFDAVLHTPEFSQLHHDYNDPLDMHQRKTYTQKLLEAAHFSSIHLETRDFFAIFKNLDAFFAYREATLWVVLFGVFPLNIRATIQSKVKAQFPQIIEKVKGEQHTTFFEKLPVLFISAEK